MQGKALRDHDWLRSAADRRRYLCALITAPAAAAAALVVALAGGPVLLVLLLLAALLLCVLHTHLLAADRLGLLQQNSAEVHWQHYRAVWWLHLGGPLRRVR